jgi:aspartate/methionine/tyrosine aminotransferase
MTDPFFSRALAQLTGASSGYAQAFDTAGGKIDLATGEVRYPLPADVLADIANRVSSLDSPWYANPAGEDTLRAAYLRYLGEPPGHDIGRVLVTGGGKEAAWLAVRYLLDSGGALVPSPGWEAYGLWLHAGAAPHLAYDPAQLAADPLSLRQLAATASMLILNYPHNPTGIRIDQGTMDAIIGAAAEMGLAVVSDEVYRAFAPGQVSATRSPAYDPARHIVIDSCSKWLAAAGLRIGFLIADPAIVRALTLFRSSYASMTSTPAQRIAETLISSPAAGRWLAGARAAVDATRCATARHLADLGVPVASHGSIYIWCRAPSPGELPDPGPEAAQAVIAEGRRAGMPGYVRICPARYGLEPAAAAAAVVSTLRRR